MKNDDIDNDCIEKAQIDSVQLNQFVPYRMVQLASNISLALSKIYKQTFDITIPEWRVLAQLAEQQKLYSKDIGEITSMDKSKVSRAVKALESKDYLIKQTDKKDNRAVYLSLSVKGQSLYQKIAPKALQWEKQFISVLEASEHRNLMKVLDKLDKQVLLMGDD
ncbi:MarR family winged helix-turn-helix transcriptional regulator [uncultured Paraglaciecola sp.]|uniref:MarR family winged helix-turn-helix transcriptional regulator n=1 Tax=uncultured Paraglaciecola sp. TaxID=1765024 RepID=UPI0026095E0B|nr:MarR family winged helix-turn-helix transcriptional regulator [uncultured Paraglaciecola sp.]